MFRTSLAVYRNAYAGLSTPIWWLALVMLVNRAGTMVIPFLTVYLTTKMNFSISEAGIVMGFFGAGAILGGFLGGRISDKIGFSSVQFWSLLLNGVLFIILGQMHTLWQFCMCIFILSSVGESFRPANAAAIAFYSVAENRTRSYSLNRLAINLGWSIGPAAGGILASISYQWLFLVDGITCMVAALLLHFCLPPVHLPEKTLQQKEEQLSAQSAYRDGIYLRFMFFVFLVALCFLQLFSMLPVFYKKVIHLNESVIGLILAMNGIIIALIEMVMVYKLEGKRSPVYYISFGAMLIGFSYVFLNIGGDYIGTVLMAMVIITFGEMLLFPFVNAFWISRSREHNRGQYAAVYTIAFSAAHVLAPTLGSQIVNHFGFNVLWYVVFLICLIASAGFYQFKKIYI